MTDFKANLHNLSRAKGIIRRFTPARSEDWNKTTLVSKVNLRFPWPEYPAPLAVFLKSSICTNNWPPGRFKSYVIVIYRFGVKLKQTTLKCLSSESKCFENKKRTRWNYFSKESKPKCESGYFCKTHNLTFFFQSLPSVAKDVHFFFLFR